MFSISRKRFLKNASITWGGLVLAQHWPGGSARTHPLSFSTLGCPSWTFPAIVDFAAANGYQGIEIRGITGELDLPKCPEFSAGRIGESKRMLADKNLKIVDLGSSAAMHHRDAAERGKNMDDGKRFIDLAQALDCPNIRVFPNDLPKGPDRPAVIQTIIEGLLTLGDYAKASNVHVLLESHGDCVVTADLLQIMSSCAHPQVGMVWDICNMWAVTKETPAFVYGQLKPYIRHAHIKDVQFINGAIHYVLLGKGEAPIEEAVRLLDQGGYNGFYSFEWEKMWHPEIEAPEIALARFPEQINKYFKD
jgi:sugar phosphate isomerase/epimerase